jgi:hypothetical protein
MKQFNIPIEFLDGTKVQLKNRAQKEGSPPRLVLTTSCPEKYALVNLSDGSVQFGAVCPHMNKGEQVGIVPFWTSQQHPVQHYSLLVAALKLLAAQANGVKKYAHIDPALPDSKPLGQVTGSISLDREGGRGASAKTAQQPLHPTP